MDLASYKCLWGGALLGSIVFAISLGVASVQCSIYFSKFHRDPLITRLVVILICLLMFGNLTCYTYFTQNALNTKYGTSVVVTSAQGAIFPLNVSMTATTTQLYFTHRLHQLNGHILLTVILLVLTFSQLGLGIAATLVYMLTFDPADPCKEGLPYLMAWLGDGVLVDVIISVMMCSALKKLRTGFRPTDSAIRTLIRYTVGTGVLTTTLSFVILFTFAFSGVHWAYVGMSMPVGGLYAISLLANLLSRSHARKSFEVVQPNGLSIHTSHIPKHVEGVLFSGTTSRDSQA